MDIEFPRRERDYVDLERVDQSLRDAAMIWLAHKIELYEDDTLVARAAHPLDAHVARVGSLVRHPTSRRSRTSRARRSPTTRRSSGSRGILDVLFEYPIQSDRSHFSIHMAFDRLGITRRHRAALHAAGRRRARLRARRRCGTRAARSALAPGGRCASSTSGSSTSSTASITCCSCSASSSRSAASGRSSRS